MKKVKYVSKNESVNFKVESVNQNKAIKISSFA